MKRNIIRLLLCSIGLLSLNSCRDALDIEQEGILDKDAVFKSTTDLDNFLRVEVYPRLNIGSQIGFTSMFTDEVGIGPAFTGFGVGPHQFYIDINSGDAASIWLANYSVINRVNRLLEGAKSISPTTNAEKATYNSVLAHARALRAFSYLQLLTFFSTDMKDPNALGVIVLDHVPTVAEQLPRTPNKDAFAAIEEDLKFAENNISGSDKSYLYVSKSMIFATKARFYLYTGNHSLAKVNAEKALSTSGLSLTPVGTMPTQPLESTNWHRALNAYTTTSSYVKMLQDTEQGEVIFAFSRPVANTWQNISSLYNSNSSTINNSIYDMGRNLFNILDASKGDIRRYAYIDPTSKPSDSYLTDANYISTDILVIDKYPGKLGSILRNDIKVFRVSEMLLILAECAVNENRLGDAAGIIKSIRDARNYRGITTLPVYANAAAAWADVLLERRVELAFEGHRYIDLKRLGTLANKSIDRSITDDISKDNPTTIPNVDYRWTLPIPINELQGNTAIQQNPGYKSVP